MTGPFSPNCSGVEMYAWGMLGFFSIAGLFALVDLVGGITRSIRSRRHVKLWIAQPDTRVRPEHLKEGGW